MPPSLLVIVLGVVVGSPIPCAMTGTDQPRTSPTLQPPQIPPTHLPRPQPQPQPAEEMPIVTMPPKAAPGVALLDGEGNVVYMHGIACV